MAKTPAYNPFLHDFACIADGETHVFGDRVYVFGSHDEPGGQSFCLLDYEFYSAPLNDLSAWTSKGVNYSARQDPLYGDGACYLFAPDVVQGNDGRFYLYYCLAGWKGEGGYSHPISVAVCDTPDGRYEYLGVVRNEDGSPYQDFVCFDPAVMNDGGTIRLYFGSGPFRGLYVKPWNALVLARVYSRVFDKPARAFFDKPGPLGANAVVLRDDMLTLAQPPRRIADTPDFHGHAFFEGCSIRKIRDTYYFVYSSEKNHELCYATSPYPDRGFRFGGTLVSNGDIGYLGRPERERTNATGTNHGGIECINGIWYVFYHRLSHGSDYSRQMCAEPLYLLEDGSIPQAEMSSCGLNGGVLPGEGSFSATICCNLSNGSMPHIANRARADIPRIVCVDDRWYIADACVGTSIRYKYFKIADGTTLRVVARHPGSIKVQVNGRCVGCLDFGCEEWGSRELEIAHGCPHAELEFCITKGTVDVLSFTMDRRPLVEPDACAW